MKFRILPKQRMKEIVMLGVVAFTPCLAFAGPQAISCGDTLPRGHFRLSHNIECEADTTPAITLTEGTVLDLNGYTIDCENTGRNGIVISGTGATVLNGTIRGCRDGVTITGDHTQLVRVTAHDNTRAGFFVNGGDNNVFVNCVAHENGRQGFNIERPESDVAGADDNHFVNCVAAGNGRHGFKILRGDGNHLRRSEALANCRDGIEIEEGDDNSIINNRAEANGNEETCATFGEAYRPWFYAGIDILNLSFDNKVINNKTSGNTGCTAQRAAGPCEEALRDRNLWDENVDEVTGECISTNRWNNNREDDHKIDPECAPGPL